MAFHHWTAVATGTGQLYLMRRSLTIQTGRIERRKNLLRAGLGIQGLDGFRDANGENAALMQGLTEDRVMDAEITGQ